MDWIKGLCCVVITSLIGLGVVNPLLKKEVLRGPERMALSFGIGIGLITLVMLFLSWVGIPFSMRNILLPSTLVVIPGLFWMRGAHAPAVAKEGRFSFSERLLFCGISFEGARAFFRALLKPIESYDSIAHYAFKGKIFFFEKGIPDNFFETFAVHKTLTEDYPLLIPLAESWFRIFLGHWEEFVLKLIFPIYFVCLLLVFYSACRRVVQRPTALLCTFFLATTPQVNNFAIIGYADLPFTFYAVSSFLYLFLWMERKGKGAGLLILSALLAGFALWTKIQGLAWFGVGLLLFAFFLARERHFLKRTYGVGVALWGAIVLALNLPWFALKRSFGMGTFHFWDTIAAFASAAPTPTGLFQRSTFILYEFQKHLLGPKKWNILWILVVLLMVRHFKRLHLGRSSYPFFAGLFLFLSYVSIYLFVPYFRHALPHTASRMLIHLTPLALFWSAMVFEEEKQRPMP